MKKEAEGVVISVKDNIAKVRVSRHGSCSNCGMCPGDNAAVMDVYNVLGAQPGQRVVLEIQENNMLSAAFIVYLLPLLVAVIGIVIGNAVAPLWHDNRSISAILFSLCLFVISVIFIKRYDNKLSHTKKMLPVITKVFSQTEKYI